MINDKAYDDLMKLLEDLVASMNEHLHMLKNLDEYVACLEQDLAFL